LHARDRMLHMGRLTAQQPLAEGEGLLGNGKVN
jgi:hypothetical protein